MTMIRSIRALLVLCAVLLCTAATFATVDGNADCVLNVEAGGTFPEPEWRPNTEKCEGSCPTSGACELKDKSTEQNKQIWGCECPSGSGDTGCRAQSTYRRLGPNDPWVYDGLKCVGEKSCPKDQSSCDWHWLGPAPGTDHWATCKCQ